MFNPAWSSAQLSEITHLTSLFNIDVLITCPKLKLRSLTCLKVRSLSDCLYLVESPAKQSKIHSPTVINNQLMDWDNLLQAKAKVTYPFQGKITSLLSVSCGNHLLNRWIHSPDALDCSERSPALIYRQSLVGSKGITPGFRFNQFLKGLYGECERTVRRPTATKRQII